MSEPHECESLLIDNLAWIDRVVASLCRRNGLRGDDADEFASWVRMKLVDDDYAIFRKFRGESAITTYLTVVLSMLLREYRVAMWGRWRPSAAAQRHGPVAVRLEMLVHRDGYTVDQAAQIIRDGGETELSGRELVELLAELPRRGPLRPVEVNAEALVRYAGGESADGLVEAEELAEDRRRATEALAQAVGELDPEDGVILRMKYWEGLSVADVARALDLPQKPLYRRITAVLRTLRASMEAMGVSGELVSELVEAGDNPVPGPSMR